MKTLLFTTEYPPFKGGVANYYGNLVKYYPEPDNISVLHNNDGRLLKNWVWPKWLFALWALGSTIKKEKINHVLVGQILPLGTVAYYVAKFTKTPYTVIIHGMDMIYAQKTGRKRKISRKVLEGAKYIICASSYTASLVKKFIREDQINKIHIVNPGVEGLRAKNYELQAKKIQKKHRLFNKIILFSVGRLVRRKGFDKVIKAMSEVVRVVPNLYYFIAGDGQDKKYIYKKAKGVPNVVFLSKITDEEKWAWLEACDIFITAARDIEGDFEGFGIVYLEANIFGKPVIAGDSGGVRDAVKGAYSGLLVDPENIERITDAIIRLAGDKELREKLGEQGRKRAVEEFSWNKKANKIFDIISDNT